VSDWEVSISQAMAKSAFSMTLIQFFFFDCPMDLPAPKFHLASGCFRRLSPQREVWPIPYCVSRFVPSDVSGQMILRLIDLSIPQSGADATSAAMATVGSWRGCLLCTTLRAKGGKRFSQARRTPRAIDPAWTGEMFSSIIFSDGAAASSKSLQSVFVIAAGAF